MSDILERFEQDCREWYHRRGNRNLCEGRLHAYVALGKRHGWQAVFRHDPAIARALTNVELRYATGAAAERLREG
jgi:hypothetical protein